eukprot:PhM_4_TR7985/c0_g1_i1/m.83597
MYLSWLCCGDLSCWPGLCHAGGAAADIIGPFAAATIATAPTGDAARFEGTTLSPTVGDKASGLMDMRSDERNLDSDGVRSADAGFACALPLLCGVGVGGAGNE